MPDIEDIWDDDEDAKMSHAGFDAISRRILEGRKRKIVKQDREDYKFEQEFFNQG